MEGGGVRLEPLKRGVNHGRCEAGCRSVAAGKDVGWRGARFRLWLIGRPTLLCDPCAKVWERAYVDARDGWPDERAAA